MGAAPNGFLDLWARDHYKSTISTFGLGLQDVLASHGDDPEPRYGGREVTIGIFSHTRPIAKGFLRQIKRECENNETLKALFPDVLWSSPQSEAPKWSEDDGLVFRRRSNPKESTIEAWGLVDGQPISKHFTHRDYDDVVTERSVTPDMIPKTTSAWELSENLGTETGVFRIKGTRYHLFDTYSVMMERGIPARIYPCTSDGSEDFDNKAVLRSPQFLKDKRRLQGPYTFGAQMLLNPKADTAQGFKLDWVKYWPAKNFTGLNFYILVDPASRKKSTSDYTSMWVIGVGGDEHYYVCDAIRDRLNLTERTKALFSLHRKWRPQGVGYEEYGVQADREHMEYVMAQENYRFGITPLGGVLKSKADRIRRLVPIFEQGRMLLPQAGIVYRTIAEQQSVNLIKTFLDEEYVPFPVLAHDDMLDAMSRILDDDFNVIFPQPLEDQMPKWMQDLIDDGAEGDFMTA